ncbi:MAG TPA: hypothetical protein VMS74_01055, partial [Acidimicrobiia bacterium]|nr:hypothetical protein [Acidimicrobiia bacterium]
WWEGFQLQWRAHHSRELGYLDESAEWLDRAYRVALDRGTINQIAFITSNQAALAWHQGDVAATYAKTIEFAEANRSAAENPLNPFVLEMSAAAAVAWDLFEVAARLCGAAEGWRRPGGLSERGMPLPQWDLERHAEVLRRIEERLGADTRDARFAEGRALNPQTALDLALSLTPKSVS